MTYLRGCDSSPNTRRDCVKSRVVGPEIHAAALFSAFLGRKWGEQLSEPAIGASLWIVQNIFTQSPHGADRPCRCAQDRVVFEESCTDLSILSWQGRRLMHKPFGRLST